LGERHPSDHQTGLAATHPAASPPGTGMKRVAEQAPIWVIAIMAHLALAAVFAVTYVRIERPSSAEDGFTIGERPKSPVLDDGIVVEIPRDHFRVPTVKDDGRDPAFAVLTERTVWTDVGLSVPDGTDGGRSNAPGPDGIDVLHSSVIGPGEGTPRGGSASRGLFAGPNPRIVRLEQVAAKTKAPPVIKGGLRWLREHQSEDGMWDCDGFHLRCDPKLGAACSGQGSAAYDVGVTGLALLAFLGAGYDGRGSSRNDEALRKGLRWLVASQDAEGCFGPREDSRFTYSHACATIAMCEAATFDRRAAWRRSAQSALRFVERCHNPYKGWRYGVAPGESDASVTGWMLLALKAGKDAGLEVSARAMRDGLAFLDGVTDPADGRTGYLRRGELPVRLPGSTERWPAEESESLTAVALCARIFCGEAPGKDAAALLSKRPPRWDPASGSIDMYYWYYATLAMHQIGGTAWEQWNKSLEKAVVESQVKEGCAEGSWDPSDPWGAEGGRVYSTALMTLCLEVYWRYPLVFGARK
jgi:hypothetical protein